MTRYRGESEDSIRSQWPEGNATLMWAASLVLCVRVVKACYFVAAVGVWQASIYSGQVVAEDDKVVTLYHPAPKKDIWALAATLDVAGEFPRCMGGFREESGSLWQLRFNDGGVQVVSVGQSGPASDFLPDDRPLGNDCFLAGCGMERVINVDAPRTFSIRHSICSSVLPLLCLNPRPWDELAT